MPPWEIPSSSGNNFFNWQALRRMKADADKLAKDVEAAGQTAAQENWIKEKGQQVAADSYQKGLQYTYEQLNLTQDTQELLKNDKETRERLLREAKRIFGQNSQSLTQAIQSQGPNAAAIGASASVATQTAASTPGLQQVLGVIAAVATVVAAIYIIALFATAISNIAAENRAAREAAAKLRERALLELSKGPKNPYGVAGIPRVAR